MYLGLRWVYCTVGLVIVLVFWCVFSVFVQSCACMGANCLLQATLLCAVGTFLCLFATSLMNFPKQGVTLFNQKK